MPSSIDVVGFPQVFSSEISSINDMRGGRFALGRRVDPPITLHQEGTYSTGEIILAPNEEANLVGLSLSGGGIRSAAFCLGVLQALNRTDVLHRIDYMSTVSGGGYVGISLSASLEMTRGEFPFETDFPDENPVLQHLRNYSNYLFPHGAQDLLVNFAIYARGLVTNFLLIMPFLLVPAALTILWNPTSTDLRNNSVAGFPKTLFLAGLFICLALLWAVGRQMKWEWLWLSIRQWGGTRKTLEIKPGFGAPMAMGLMLLAVGFSAVCELQPKILAEMFGLNVALAGLTDSLSSILLIIAPYCVVIAVFARKLSEFIEIARESRDLRTQIAAFFAKVAIYTAAIGVVLLMSTLWLVYLHLSYWGICINSPALYADGWCNVPDWVVAGLAILSNIFTEFGLWLFKRELSPYEAVIAGYSLLAVSFTLIAVLLSPNSNSLNALYRDRLGKAFLFMPQPTLQRHEELKPLDVNLSEFHGTCGPYHLINAALNVQNSKEANKRGRNADFFIFSKNFTGSKTTGYVKTAEIEKVESELDLATMMAISGAAASTGMGSQTHKVLTPIMAILNIRLGYWLHNPLKINKRKSLFGNFYFLAELFGLLNERRRAVYLTDGGHIENLGLYELLKRSCRVIIAVDSEADPELTFGSLHTLRRYARIDLGVEIDLPWQQIQAAGVASRSAVGRNQEEAPMLMRPHCAIGHIRYPHGRIGMLIYIKATVTGDEDDSILFYRARFPTFPHETTLDQWFTEEQFEAYRALGYHSAYGLFGDRDSFAHRPGISSTLELLDQLFPASSERPWHLSFVERLSKYNVSRHEKTDQ